MKYKLSNVCGAVIYTADVNDYSNAGVVKGVAAHNANRCGVNLSSVDLTGANLDDLDMRGSALSRANLSCARLRGTDLRNTDMSSANMRNTVISGADLRGAKLPYYDITPTINDIHKTVYADAMDNLETSEWHSECGTIHCWAGWIVTLAGDAGRKLELLVNTGPAAALILMKSDPDLATIPDWHTDNTAALSEMRRLAE